MAGFSIRSIAASLGRAAATISREIKRNGGRSDYRATDADCAPWDRALRPKQCKLVQNKALRSVPLRTGPLPAKFKEMILVAIDAATTHLYAPGVRRHMKNAIKHGAATEELLEVIQLTTLLGIHSCNLAVPILMEEIAATAREV